MKKKLKLEGFDVRVEDTSLATKTPRRDVYDADDITLTYRIKIPGYMFSPEGRATIEPTARFLVTGRVREVVDSFTYRGPRD